MMNTEELSKHLLATITGEMIQPVRLYFHVPDKNLVDVKFSKLNCMKPDPPRKRWVWLYEKEAKKLSFSKSYADIPAKVKPLVLGSFYFNPPHEVYLEVRSIERAIHALTFFDKYLGRKVAEAREIAVVNRLLNATENNLSYDYLFEHEVKEDGETLLAEMADYLGEKSDPQKTLQFLEKKMSKPEPEMVRQSLNFYEYGIAPIRALLKMRQIIAKEHSAGNTAFTFKDLVEGLSKIQLKEKP
jgi:hypothetical protein